MDARYEHVRDGGRVVSMAVVVAYGVRADGVREVLGLDGGLSEDVEFWRSFFQRLVARGLRGVQLVISDGVTTDCWQTTYATAIANNATRFNAKGP